MTELNFDPSEVIAEETHAVLHKYDGDFTAEEIDAGLAGEPIETIVIENNEIVQHLINGVPQPINGAEGGI